MSEHLPSSETSESQHAAGSAAEEYYRILTAEDVVPDVNSLAAGQESVPDPRLLKLFAPRLTKEEKGPEGGDSSQDMTDFYYRLVTDRVDDTELTALQQKRRLADEKDATIKEPTDMQKFEAYGRIREAESKDPYLEAILNKHTSKGESLPDYVSIVDSVRTNPELRYELGSYLLRDKLPKLLHDQPHALPYRVFVNTEKNPNHAGYRQFGKLFSQEYVSMLALSMLDGTYSEPGVGDSILLNKEKPENTLGQHRLGAAVLLDITIPHEVA